MPKQSGTMGNLMLGYEKGGFDFRLAMKYRDRYIDELVDPGYDRYTSEHTQWDITAKYRLSDSWLVYAELTNIGDEPEHYYAGQKRRLFQYDEYGTISSIGFQYNFQE
jgi:outer membrane receptor protein involved in Fe transport